MEIGIGFSGEELSPDEIVRAAARAEEFGFRTAWVSDHFHPWIDAQGQSPFVWTVLGGIANATETLRVGTGVTCPIMRIHPAIVAQAAATTACMFDGRFWLGVGTGEALNEHVLGDKWPEADIRLEMLDEAVGVMRDLWRGEQTSHYGKYFTVENARIYTRPQRPTPIYVSAFGSKSAKLAARIGDGLVSTKPDASLLRDFDNAGGHGPKLAQCKVAFAPTRQVGEDLVYERWPTSGVSGQLSQDLPTPAHFEQAVETVRREDAVEGTPCGPDANEHIDALRRYEAVGYDEVYVTQIGPDQEAFLRFYRDEVLPEFATKKVSRSA
jgi:G6PDH family F420-dependent oxidoreductase